MTLDEAAQSRLEVESVSFKSRKSRKVNICMELRKFAILSLWRRSCISEELAERIGIDSSPLSKAIMQLESELGVQLFVRARAGAPA